MTADEALAEVIAYLQGVGESIDPQHGSRLIIEQLAVRGFSVQPVTTAVLGGLSPAALRQARLSLGLSVSRFAKEAGLKDRTVSNAEGGKTRAHPATLTVMADTLVRLGALRVEPWPEP